jgi:hypothetical protein
MGSRPDGAGRQSLILFNRNGSYKNPPAPRVPPGALQGLPGVPVSILTSIGEYTYRYRGVELSQKRGGSFFWGGILSSVNQVCPGFEFGTIDINNIKAEISHFRRQKDYLWVKISWMNAFKFVERNRLMVLWSGT